MYINALFIIEPKQNTSTITAISLFDYGRVFTQAEYKDILEFFGGKYNAKSQNINIPCRSIIQIEGFLRNYKLKDESIPQNEIVVKW